MSLFSLYLMFVLPEVAGLLDGLGLVAFVLAGAIYVFVFIGGLLSPDDEDAIRAQSFRRPLGCVVVAGICAMCLAALMPSEKAMMYIVGGYAATNIEGVEKLGPNFVGAANAFLEKHQFEEAAE